MLSLSHRQLQYVMDAAKTLPVEKRSQFLQRLSAMLELKGRFSDRCCRYCKIGSHRAGAATGGLTCPIPCPRNRSRKAAGTFIWNPVSPAFARPVSRKSLFVKTPDFVGAGERNRTAVISLEGCCSTIELHPRTAHQADKDRMPVQFSSANLTTSAK
jgi:hypothetical protein